MAEPRDYLQKIISPAGAVILLVFVAVVIGYFGLTPLEFDGLTSAAIGTHLLTLIFVALIIERAVEVYVNNTYSRAELDASRELRLRKARLDKLAAVRETIRTEVPPAGLSSEEREGAVLVRGIRIGEIETEIAQDMLGFEDIKNAALQKLDNIKASKAASAVTAATLMGTAVAIVGVQTLRVLTSTQVLSEAPANAVETVVVNGEQVQRTISYILEGSTQAWLLIAVDTALTALLLAGGADGIHQIINRFTSFEKDILET